MEGKERGARHIHANALHNGQTHRWKQTRPSAQSWSRSQSPSHRSYSSRSLPRKSRDWRTRENNGRSGVRGWVLRRGRESTASTPAADTVDAANANRARAYIGHFIVALELTNITCRGSAGWLAGAEGNNMRMCGLQSKELKAKQPEAIRNGIKQVRRSEWMTKQMS